ncbi:ABC transporter ATP-binding protein [Natrarchaeobius oligotrophus]|uniref:ABC transporter ATP-binding protein n=1 Tax=Natrarchaeobius chitinivorans TaxID=1679083 RepID=A0A3N6M790_NATCH|nr:ABC transporter ATP-binding protein [Natrarchaeobius chitinivorans]RQG99488.1 ABC transporter ATP-binding protein [Natrarchaeobius chitinivorans]
MLLEIASLTKTFGGITAVDDLSLEIDRDSVHAVIGPNGAGKTTLFKLIAGTHTPDTGTISFDGTDLVGLDPHERVHCGLAKSYQITNIFPELTVLQNVKIARQRQEGHQWNFWSKTDDLPELTETALEVLAEVGLEEQPETVAKNLSHGEKRQLELAIAIACDPELLLLDEPAAGMSQAEVGELRTLLERLAEEYTILFIDHNMDLVTETADRITVMADGAVVSEGTPSEIQTDSQVQQVYLGGA